MCGRYAVYSKHKDIANTFGIKQIFRLEQSYNIAPTEFVSALYAPADGERIIAPMRWGLIPHWQSRPKLSSALINARIESIDSKPSFKQAILKRRCLILADGFYEWVVTEQKIRQPYFIYMKDKKPFAFAGIWERWVNDEGSSIDSCCIITLEANTLLTPLHNRMPAIIKLEDASTWLSPTNHNWQKLSKLITSEPHDNLTYAAVSTKVNNAKYKHEDCITPLTVG